MTKLVPLKELPPPLSNLCISLSVSLSFTSSSSLQNSQGRVHVAVHDEVGCLFGIFHRLSFSSTGPGSMAKGTGSNDFWTPRIRHELIRVFNHGFHLL